MNTRPPRRRHQCSNHNSSSPRRRVLQSACQLFAKHGFEGTSIRKVCSLARVNIAVPSYYFHDKQHLYAAAQAEAKQRLSGTLSFALQAHVGRTLQQQLRVLIESLLTKLSANSAWIARFLAREVTDDSSTFPTAVGAGFRANLRLIESMISNTLGPQTDRHTLRLATLNLLSLCVFLSIAESKLPRFFSNSRQQHFAPKQLAADLVHLLLWGLNGITSSPIAPHRPRPRSASCHYGKSQFKKWLRWMETHHHETTNKQYGRRVLRNTWHPDASGK